MRGARVIVTGASGFVGSRVVAGLAGAGAEVVPVSRRTSGHDLLDPASVDALVSEAGASHLVHLAWTTTHGAFWSDPTNLDWAGASLRLLRRFHQAGGRRALVVGSCAEYDWSSPGPYAEHRAGPPPRTLYGAAKLATSLAALAYGRETGLEVAWGRLFHLYGPGESPARLIPQIVSAASAGRSLQLDNPGSTIDLLHVDDAAASLVALLGTGVTGAVNVASGLPVQVGQVAGLLGGLAGLAAAPDAGSASTSASTAAVVYADVSRLNAEVGPPPPRPLEHGLAELWSSQRPSEKEPV